MRRVMVETPYAGDVEWNVMYARRCMADALKRGEAPMLSHLLYTQVLDDTKPDERDLGINAGLAWRKSAEAGIFYLDLGISSGMMRAAELYTVEEIPIEERYLLNPPKAGTLRNPWLDARALRRAQLNGWREVTDDDRDYGGTLMWCVPARPGFNETRSTRSDLIMRYR